MPCSDPDVARQAAAERRRPLLLDLFCGAGGAARGYHDAGFDVLGIDIEDHPNYPYRFIRADTFDFLDDADLTDFAAIHASPPCQRWSVSSKRWNGKQSYHPDLIAPIRKRLLDSDLPYVIENVPGAPLIDPLKLCGSMFGLGVRRHRLFECGRFFALPMPCSHHLQTPRYRVYNHGRWYLSPVVSCYGTGGGKAKEHWPEAMGIDWMTDGELAQAIPPAYTEYIGRQLIRTI